MPPSYIHSPFNCSNPSTPYNSSPTTPTDPTDFSICTRPLPVSISPRWPFPTHYPPISPTSSTNKPENDEKNSSIVKPPSSFDGSYSKYRDWLRQVKLLHPVKHLTAANDKIISTLSYMMKGSTVTCT